MCENNKVNQEFYKIIPTHGQGSTITASEKCDDGFYVTGYVSIDSSGYYNDFTEFQQQNVTLANSKCIFITKLTHEGKQIYFKLTGNPNNSNNQSQSYITVINSSVYICGTVLTDGNGNVYDFETKLQQNSFCQGIPVAFVATLDKDGCQKFYKTAGATTGSNDSANSTGINSFNISPFFLDNGHKYIYVCGTLSTGNDGAYVDFNQSVHSSIFLNNQIIFVARITEHGEQVFFKIAGTTTTGGGQTFPSNITGIKAYNDRVYIIGSMSLSSNVYYDFTLNPQTTQIPVYLIFIASINSNGYQMFFKIAGSALNIAQDNTQIINLDVSASGVCVTGDIAINSDHNYYDFTGYLKYSPIYYTSDHFAQPAFVAKLNYCGEQIFFKMTGGNNVQSYGNNIIFNNGIYVLGYIEIDENSYYYDFNQKLIKTTISPFGLALFISKLSERGDQIFYKINYTNGSCTGIGLSKNIIKNDGCNDGCDDGYIDQGIYVYASILTNPDGSYTDFDSKKRYSNIIDDYIAVVAKIQSNGHQKFYKITGPYVFDQNLISNIISFDDNIYIIGNLSTLSATTVQYYDFNNKEYTVSISPPISFFDQTVPFIAKLYDPRPIVFM